MASTPVRFVRSYHSSLTAKLVGVGGTGTPNASGYACTNTNGMQAFTVPESLAGAFYVYAHDAQSEIAYQGYVLLADTTDTHYVSDDASLIVSADIDSYTIVEALRLVSSVSVGLASGGGTTTNEFKAIDESKVRVESTIDSSGNRTAIVLDAS